MGGVTVEAAASRTEDPRGRRQGLLAPRAAAVAAARGVAAAAAGWPSGGGTAMLGVVLGTGMGGLADRLEDVWAIPARETGWLASPTATGHAGRVVVGRIDGCRIAALQGRVHGYEGHGPERLSRGVEFLAALGATTLLATNAAGGLRSDMQVGELVVVSDHIDLVRRHWAAGLEEPRIDGPDAAATTVAGWPSTGCYDGPLVARALEAARRAAANAREGVYAHCLGPSYETRAEYRMLRRLGADVVGMSTVPEVVAARRLGLRVAVVSVVTNVACPDAAGGIDAEDVCHAAAGAAAGVWEVLRAIAAACRDETAFERTGSEGGVDG